MEIIHIPKLGVNEDSVNVVEWVIPQGEKVEPGTVIAKLESTKSIFDLEASDSGILGQLVEEDTSVKVNSPVAVISENAEEMRKQVASITPEIVKQEQETGGSDQVLASHEAKQHAENKDVTLSNIETTGPITKQDVVNHLANDREVKEKLDSVKKKINDYENTVCIYGASQGGITIYECIELNSQYTPVCFLDDDPDIDDWIFDLPVLPGSSLSNLAKFGLDTVVPAISDSNVRLQILRQCIDLSVELFNVIHPEASISPSAKLGEGNYVKDGAIVGTNTTIENCCIIDNGAIIPHDNHLKDACHVTPGVQLGSNVTIGKKAIVGIGSSVATGVHIGTGAIISVGSSVTEDVDDFAIIEGVPGKQIGIRKK